MSEILDCYLASLRPGVGPTHRQRPAAFCAWLEKNDLELTREAVERWIRLRERKYAPGTVRLEFGQIHRVFTANGVEWPFRPREGPQVAEGDEDQPMISIELGSALIEASGRLQPVHRALLAISTTYATRRAEMTYTWNLDAEQYDGMGNDSFDWEENLVFVETVKSGRQRYHLVPESIIPIVKAFDWGKERSDSFVSQISVDLREAAGLEQANFQRVAWHAIRRRMAKLLLDGNSALELPGFSEPDVNTYMRWKPPTSSMAQRYAGGQEVGLDGRRSQQLERRDLTLDRRAFGLIPWLEDWERLHAVS